MKYPCEIIRDLLPLYVDDVVSEESRSAVDEHLTECDSCREMRDELRANNVINDDSCENCENKEEKIMTDSLKKVKLQINRKQRRAIALAVAAVLVVLGGWQVLFNMPLKAVDPADVRITAGSYRLQELPYQLTTGSNDEGDGMVTISMYDDTDEKTPTYRVEIPAMPDSKLQVTEDMLDAGGYVSVVSVESKCRLANIDWGIDGDVMYIHGFKTTLVGRHTDEFSYRNDSIDFRPVNKVVLLDKDGTQTILWENTTK